MSSFTPRLLFWRTNKRKMNLPSGTQKSITTNAPQGFSMYFKPDNNNHVGRTKDNLNKHWFTPEYLLCAGHGAAHWKYMISTNSRDISNRKLWWALPLVTHMPSLRPRVWKSLGLNLSVSLQSRDCYRTSSWPPPHQGTAETALYSIPKCSREGERERQHHCSDPRKATTGLHLSKIPPGLLETLLLISNSSIIYNRISHWLYYFVA